MNHHEVRRRIKAAANSFFGLVLLISLATFAAERPSRTTEPWSWKPLRKVQVPEIKGVMKHPIDRFLLTRLAEKGLSISTEAEANVLVRRVYFDLLGLPPSPEEIAAFAADRSPKKFEALIDRLLGSPHYGERWARHWLDVVRYTESQGFEYDKLRENAWHYRDYVIQSFNEDKPYEVFVKEQIAGDVMEPVTTNSIIATSLLVCGPWDEAGSSQANVPQRMTTREEELEDLVSVVSQTFLATTMNCARCHAHKFDPIPHKDYFRFKAVFEGIKHGERPIATPKQLEDEEKRVVAVKNNIRALEQTLAVASVEGKLKVKKSSTKTSPHSPAVRYTFEDAQRYAKNLRGAAVITNQLLVLPSAGSFLEGDLLEDKISEKTLEAWVILSDLDQRGGGIISIERTNGAPFDAIVFGEREPRKWTSGSENFVRTRDLGGAEENGNESRPVHMAIVYESDGDIAVYRNGQSYGTKYKPGSKAITYNEGETRVLLGKRHTGGGSAYFKGAIIEASIYKRALTSEEIRSLYHASAFKEARFHHAEEELVKKLKTELALLKKQLNNKLPVTYAGTRVQPEPTRLLKRGEVTRPAEVTPPGSFSTFATNLPRFELSANAPEAERRKALAEWIASPQNPLTARAMVNRIWQHHFGEGLVSTPNDFGNAGGEPTDPALLDWLASMFIEEGWSIKKMHKLIMTSAAYKQSSAFNKDASKKGDGLPWRFPPRRLSAEEIRDSLLAISGELNTAQGGPSFKPFDEIKFSSSTYMPKDKIGPEFNRRSIYRMNVNSGKDPMLDVFDCPDPSVKTPRRNVTTTPLQALALMNNSFVQRQAEITARKAENRHGNDQRAAITELYLRTLGRAPTKQEADKALEFTKSQSLKSLAWALFNSTEFLYVQ